ncbi:MAG: hypothetical protein IH586_02405 [Anaerolineaceae bacterium]|nr:hypothetical protein [Anaerolineaceae bacterium]
MAPIGLMVAGPVADRQFPDSANNGCFDFHFHGFVDVYHEEKEREIIFIRSVCNSVCIKTNQRLIERYATNRMDCT